MEKVVSAAAPNVLIFHDWAFLVRFAQFLHISCVLVFQVVICASAILEVFSISGGWTFEK